MDTDTPTKPTLDERYASAAGSSNLKPERDSNRPFNTLDLIAAAGMNPHRLGMQLARLMTEWDASAKPQPMKAKQLEQLSATFPRQKGGLVLVTVKRDDREFAEEVLPIVAAQRQANAWHQHELGLLLQRLKTLPAARAALVHWAQSKGIEDAVHIVAPVLLAWLQRVCPICSGVKQLVVAGTGRTSARNCGECHGTGETKVPHGLSGQRILSRIKHCRAQAAEDMRSRYSHRG